MRNLTKKGFLNKLIIVFLVIIVFNAIVPSNVVHAYDVGGALLKPINSFVLKLADGIVDMMHKVIFGTSTALLEYDTTSTIWTILAIIGTVALGIVAALAVAIAIPAALGALGTLATTLGLSGVAALTTSAATVAIGTIVKVTAGTVAIAGIYCWADSFGDLVTLPLYQISPQEIFEGKIEILNPNFFSDSAKKNKNNTDNDTDNDKIINDINNSNRKRTDTNYEETMETTDGQYANKIGNFNTKINELLKNKGYTGNTITFKVGDIVSWNSADDNKDYVAVGTKSEGAQSSDGAIDSGVSKYTVRIYQLDEERSSQTSRINS